MSEFLNEYDRQRISENKPLNIKKFLRRKNPDKGPNQIELENLKRKFLASINILIYELDNNKGKQYFTEFNQVRCAYRCFNNPNPKNNKDIINFLSQILSQDPISEKLLTERLAGNRRIPICSQIRKQFFVIKGLEEAAQNTNKPKIVKVQNMATAKKGEIPTSNSSDQLNPVVHPELSNKSDSQVNIPKSKSAPASIGRSTEFVRSSTIKNHEPESFKNLNQVMQAFQLRSLYKREMKLNLGIP